MYETYKSDDFVIVGFPANNFGGQEPGSNQEISLFCKESFGVIFPMMSKISVKGNDIDDMYNFLTKKDRNGFADSEVYWNFQKYLIDKEGKLVRVVNSKTLPDDVSILDWIKS